MALRVLGAIWVGFWTTGVRGPLHGEFEMHAKNIDSNPQP